MLERARTLLRHLGIIFVVKDITLRRRAEVQIIHAECVQNHKALTPMLLMAPQAFLVINGVNNI